MRLNLWKNLLPESNSQTTITLREYVNSGVCLFDSEDKYPIWKESHRQELEKKIIEHYAMFQLGFETPGRFKYELNVRMREIMPYYVELYKTTQYEYNPIENYSMQEEFTEDAESKGKNKGNSLEKMSDTPQGRIENLDTHLTSATKHEGDSETEGTSKSKNKGWRKGNIGVTSTQQLIQQERDITINIDMLIIDELKDLFLGVF